MANYHFSFRGSPWNQFMQFTVSDFYACPKTLPPHLFGYFFPVSATFECRFSSIHFVGVELFLNFRFVFCQLSDFYFTRPFILTTWRGNKLSWSFHEPSSSHSTFRFLCLIIWLAAKIASRKIFWPYFCREHAIFNARFLQWFPPARSFLWKLDWFFGILAILTNLVFLFWLFLLKTK